MTKIANRRRQKNKFLPISCSSEKYIIHEKKISSYKTRMILTIHNLNQQDAGSYVCVSGKIMVLFLFEQHERSFFKFSYKQFEKITENSFIHG